MPRPRTTVLGATGAMGSRVVDRLERAGHEVVRASRATGVDVTSGTGLAQALDGASTVVDCLNWTTASRRRAVDLFTRAAASVVTAARAADVRHVVVLSIVNVTRPAVRAALGYYGGKAAHEEAYAASGLPTTVVATTAWHSLAEQLLNQAAVGPLALVPAMTLQPVHPDAVADLLAEAVLAGPPEGVRRLELAGPERVLAPDLARQLAAATGRRVRVVAVPFPGATFRRTGLLPGPQVRIDERRYADWLPGSS